MISTSCFWSHGKILFLAEITAGQRSALVCNCIARAIFNHASWKSSLKIYLLHFFRNHLKTFRICSNDHLEEGCQLTILRKAFKILNSILKIYDLFFWRFLEVRENFYEDSPLPPYHNTLHYYTILSNSNHSLMLFTVHCFTGQTFWKQENVCN